MYVFPKVENSDFSVMQGKQLCLNMIVKNESRIITRLLESVIDIIDCFCICDTGSTDATVDIISNYFARHNIPGVIITEPFQDFGHNRSYALKACENIDVQYILLMDADMVLKCNSQLSNKFIYDLLKDDVYYLFQGVDSFYYKNVRIVRNKMGMSYWGVTHEYVKTPPNSKYGTIEKNVLFIHDIGDGGAKADKFERDIALLKRGLEAEPNNDRYTFYLANSYRDAGQPMNAIETFKKRIQIGGWQEEVWHSAYSIGKCYRNMGDMENAIYWFLQAHNVMPERLENLYEIINYYREIGKNTLAYSFYVMAHHFLHKNKNPDYLFLQKDVYDYKLDYELSIIGYYCNYKNYDLKRCSMRVLNCSYVDDHIVSSVMSNYKFHSDALFRLPKVSVDAAFPLGKLLGSIGLTNPQIREVMNNPDFVPSTPSIVWMKNGEVAVNIRYVNYRITENGGYQNKDHITTINVIAIVSVRRMKIIREFILEYDRSHDKYYVGLEDVRLFYHNNTLYFNANRGLPDGHMVVEHGTIDLEKGATKSTFLNMDGQRSIEKNWVLFENMISGTNQREMRAIYNWHPIILGNITNENVFQKFGEISTPRSFKNLRGSTNGCLIPELHEVWFLCHAVSYEDRRYYYHMWVVLDANTCALKKYSPLFTFQKEKVEYTLGLIYSVNDKAFVVGYSIMDRETHYMQVEKSVVDEMMLSNQNK